MSDNTTTTNPFDNQGIKEDLHNEFKTSVFVDADTQTPGIKQMLKIARTLAAFMNTEGGRLYVGVTDDGQVRGMASDLALLANSPAIVAVHTVRYNDEGFSYGATEDKFELKIRAIARALLSPNAEQCITSVLVRSVAEKLVCQIEVKPCNKDEFIYFFQKNPKLRTEEEQIIVRIGNHNKTLVGAERDAFVRKRVLAGLDAQIHAVQKAVADGETAGDYKALADAVETLLAKFAVEERIGSKITVSDGQPFTKETVMAADKPRSLAWEGSHYVDVKDWRDLILKVLEKLQEIDAAKFDKLAEQKEFSKTLIKVMKPREKHGDCYPTKFGADGKIRIKFSLGDRKNLWQEDKPLRKIIAAFGVDVSKFMFVAK